MKCDLFCFGSFADGSIFAGENAKIDEKIERKLCMIYEKLDCKDRRKLSVPCILASQCKQIEKFGLQQWHWHSNELRLIEGYMNSMHIYE